MQRNIAFMSYHTDEVEIERATDRLTDSGARFPSPLLWPITTRFCQNEHGCFRSPFMRAFSLSILPAWCNVLSDVTFYAWALGNFVWIIDLPTQGRIGGIISGILGRCLMVSSAGLRTIDIHLLTLERHWQHPVVEWQGMMLLQYWFLIDRGLGSGYSGLWRFRHAQGLQEYVALTVACARVAGICGFDCSMCKGCRTMWLWL